MVWRGRDYPAAAPRPLELSATVVAGRGPAATVTGNCLGGRGCCAVSRRGVVRVQFAPRRASARTLTTACVAWRAHTRACRNGQSTRQRQGLARAATPAEFALCRWADRVACRAPHAACRMPTTIRSRVAPPRLGGRTPATSGLATRGLATLAQHHTHTRSRERSAAVEPAHAGMPQRCCAWLCMGGGEGAGAVVMGACVCARARHRRGTATAVHRVGERAGGRTVARDSPWHNHTRAFLGAGLPCHVTSKI